MTYGTTPSVHRSARRYIRALLDWRDLSSSTLPRTMSPSTTAQPCEFCMRHCLGTPDLSARYALNHFAFVLACVSKVDFGLAGAAGASLARQVVAAPAVIKRSRL